MDTSSFQLVNWLNEKKKLGGNGMISVVRCIKVVLMFWLAAREIIFFVTARTFVQKYYLRQHHLWNPIIIEAGKYFLNAENIRILPVH